MNEPTEGQRQWFWEQCGWKKIVNFDRPWFYKSQAYTTSWWEAPDGMKRLELPTINMWALPYLFKYAVPKMKSFGLAMMGHNDPQLVAYYVSIRVESKKVCSAESEDPALALFWAIYKAFGGK